MKHTNCSKTPT